MAELTKKKIKYMVMNLAVPNGLAANQYLQAELNLDDAYNTITGIQVAQNGNAIGNALTLGAKGNDVTWIDAIPFSAWNADQGVSPDDKFMSVNIYYGAGEKFYLFSRNTVANTADALVTMVLRLEKKLDQMN